jgi:alpha 1,6-mannosyltransferase
VSCDSFPREDSLTYRYFRQLHDFVSKLSPSIAPPLFNSLYNHLPSSLSSFLPRPDKVDLGPPSMISYKTIWQTDKTNVLNADMKEWIKMNDKDGWSLNFLDDNDAWEWVRANFEGTDVEWAWSYMHRGVLRADFLRYLLPLIEGGVYSDVDVSVESALPWSAAASIRRTNSCLILPPPFPLIETFPST